MKNIVIIFNFDPPKMTLFSSTNSFEDLMDLVKKDISATSEKISLMVLIDNGRIPVTSNNFECLFYLTSPVIIDYDMDEVDGGNESVESSDGDEVEGKVKLTVNQTVNAQDLSMVDKAKTKARDRWEEEEEALLKNFYKWCVKHRLQKPERPDFDDLTKWLSRRNSTKSQLFGSRSITAIMSHYKLMADKGDFKNILFKIKKVS